MRNIRRFLIACVLLAMPASIYACLWDYDTLRQERSRFPSTLEVITGKFLRHSPEFYQWRVQDRTKKLEADPNNLAYLDDLAVAYHKLGQHDKAIEIMQRKDKISPNLYETEANISTFYFFAGDLQKSLFHVKKALAINPNAHFGREKYQKYLIEWILEKQDHSSWWTGPYHRSFSQYLERGPEPEVHRVLQKRKEAITAVLGMMRFADHKAPILLEALGSLLSRGGNDEPATDAKKLAARALLQLANGAKTEEEKNSYLDSVRVILVDHDRGNVQAVERITTETQSHFQNELSDADTWYAKLREDEIRWISEGKDVDLEFDKKYYKEPKSETTEPSQFLSGPNDKIQAALVVVGVGFVLFVVLVGLLVRYSIKKNRARSLLTQPQSEPNPSQEGA